MTHGLFQLVCGGVIALFFFVTIGVVALLDNFKK